MDTITLARTGRRPIRFEGEMLATSDGQTWAGTSPNRFYRLALYRMESGHIIVHWDYHTLWQGETGSSAVEEYHSIAQAITALEEFNPIDWVDGYRTILSKEDDGPRPSVYLKRQQALEREIRERYAAQVAQVAQDLDVVEEV